jgi:hypothetical protein
MNWHSAEMSEILPAHTRARTHTEITRTPLSCGGDECDADWLSLLRHIYIHRHTSMHVCLFSCLGIRDSWLPNSDSLSLLMQSYIPTCIPVCVYVYMYIYIYILLFSWVYLTAGALTLCFSSVQVALFEQQPVVGPASRHFRRAFIASVSVRVSRGWVLRYCAWVKVLILHRYLACICLFFYCCLCVCIFFSQQKCVYTHTDTQVCMFVFFFSDIRDSWLPNSDSLSLLIQSYMPTCLLVCVCIYIYVLLFIVFLSIPYSWLPNSLFLLDKGRFICTTTSCRPCHLTFSPGFHRLCECACFSWLSTEILCLSESVDFPSLLGMYLPVFFVLLVFFFFESRVCTGRQTDTVERLAK